MFARLWTPQETRAPRNGILLFHDSLGSVELWRDFPAKLATATAGPVMAYDRLGFGRSDACTARMPVTFVRDEAEHVPSLCAAVGFERIVLFGHSVGGGMAIAAAARWPELCLRVVTESAQAFVEDDTLGGLRTAQADFARPEQFERLKRYHGEKARWVLDNWIETWLSPEFSHWSLDEDLARVRCPVLALHGDRDEYGSTAHPERIRRLSGGTSRSVILEGCGHVPHREQTERVLHETAQFMDQLKTRVIG